MSRAVQSSILLIILHAFVKVFVPFAVLFVRVAIVAKLVFVIVFVRRRAVVRVEVESGGGAEEDGFTPLFSGDAVEVVEVVYVVVVVFGGVGVIVGWYRDFRVEDEF